MHAFVSHYVVIFLCKLDAHVFGHCLNEEMEERTGRRICEPDRPSHSTEQTRREGKKEIWVHVTADGLRSHVCSHYTRSGKQEDEERVVQSCSFVERRECKKMSFVFSYLLPYICHNRPICYRMWESGLWICFFHYSSCSTSNILFLTFFGTEEGE